jgi:hypothetical protein
MPTVLNARGSGWSDATLPPGAVYVGGCVVDRWRGGVRFKKSRWANPYKVSRRDGTRDEVIAKYRAWLLQQPELMAAPCELRGRDLVAFSPDHAGILLELANPASAALDRRA